MKKFNSPNSFELNNYNDGVHFVLIFSENLKSFERQGLNLPEDKLAKVKELKRELAEVCSIFSQNIDNDKSRIEVDLRDLDGVDESFVKSLGRTSDDKCIVKCDYPSVSAVL